MNELIEKLKAGADVFFTDAKNQLENGNSSAGRRARKASLDMEKALKEFRKQSLEMSKK